MNSNRTILWPGLGFVFGAPEQLWRIDQLIDGTYRIMPKVVPASGKKLVLVSSADRTPTLAEFDFNSDHSKWNFKTR